MGYFHLKTSYAKTVGVHSALYTGMLIIIIQTTRLLIYLRYFIMLA